MPPSTVDNEQPIETPQTPPQSVSHAKRNVLVVMIAVVTVSMLTFAGLFVFVKKTTSPASVASTELTKKKLQPAKGSLKAVDALIAQDISDENTVTDKTTSESSSALTDSINATEGLEESYDGF